MEKRKAIMANTKPIIAKGFGLPEDEFPEDEFLEGCGFIF